MRLSAPLCRRLNMPMNSRGFHEDSSSMTAWASFRRRNDRPAVAASLMDPFGRSLLSALATFNVILTIYARRDDDVKVADYGLSDRLAMGVLIRRVRRAARPSFG